jgi:hypothetical protein
MATKVGTKGFRWLLVYWLIGYWVLAHARWYGKKRVEDGLQYHLCYNI